MRPQDRSPAAAPSAPAVSRRRLPRRALPALAVTALASLAAAGGASAATAPTLYPTLQQSRDFNGGQGSWTSSIDYGGLCLTPGLLCVAITNGYSATGGNGTPATSGYDYTRASTIAAVGGRSTGILESPSFTYNGAGGVAAWKLQLTLSRRVGSDALLQLANGAHYSVDIVRASDSSLATRPIDNQAISLFPTWTAITPVVLDPTVLTVGQAYKLQIRTTLDGGASLIPGANFDYDDIALSAFPVPGVGEPGGPGAPGTPGTPGATGSPGTPGTAGAQGPAGSAGANGSDGAAGAQGASGATGATGANGAAGANGNDGANGSDGSSGTNGGDGMTTAERNARFLDTIGISLAQFQRTFLPAKAAVSVSSKRRTLAVKLTLVAGAQLPAKTETSFDVWRKGIWVPATTVGRVSLQPGESKLTTAKVRASLLRYTRPGMRIRVRSTATLGPFQIKVSRRAVVR